MSRVTELKYSNTNTYLIDENAKDKDSLALIKYIADEDKEEKLQLVISRMYGRDGIDV